MAEHVDRPERFLSHPGRALGVGAALLAVVAVLAAVLPTGPLTADLRWSEAMRDIETPFLTHVALVFNALGRGVGWLASVAAIAAALAYGRRWLALAAFTAAEALASLSSTLIKLVVGRPRPPGGLVSPHGSSFPSGHVTFAGVTCAALVLLFSAPGPRRRAWWGLAALGVAGMAWSRTYLQVHWLSDVVGGAALGVGIALMTFAAAQRRSGARGTEG